VSFFGKSSKKGSVSMSEPLSLHAGGTTAAAAAAGFALPTDLGFASPMPFGNPSPASCSQHSTAILHNTQENINRMPQTHSYTHSRRHIWPTKSNTFARHNPRLMTHFLLCRLSHVNVTQCRQTPEQLCHLKYNQTNHSQYILSALNTVHYKP